MLPEIQPINGMTVNHQFNRIPTCIRESSFDQNYRILSTTTNRGSFEVVKEEMAANEKNIYSLYSLLYAVVFSQSVL